MPAAQYLKLNAHFCCRNWIWDVLPVPLHRDVLQHHPLLGVLLHLLLLHLKFTLGLLRQPVEHRGVPKVRLQELH